MGKIMGRSRRFLETAPYPVSEEKAAPGANPFRRGEMRRTVFSVADSRRLDTKKRQPVIDSSASLGCVSAVRFLRYSGQLVSRALEKGQLG